MENSNEIKSNYILRLFRGQISLPMTYWVWFFFFNLIITVTSSFYFGSFPLKPTSSQVNISIFITILILIYSIFILIAVWRSATNHDGSKFWAIVAKIIVIYNTYLISADTYSFGQSFVNKDIALKNSIEYLNSRVPVKIKEDIYITKASLNGKSIHYTYKFNNIKEDSISSLNISLMKDSILNESCNNVDTIKLLNNQYKFYYYYTNNEDKKFAEVKFTKEDCINSKKDEELLKEIINKEKKNIKS